MTQALRYSWIERYKYILREDLSIQLNFHPDKDIITGKVCFYRNGLLLIKAGFMWDGPSGPTIDRACNMRAALVHDALYYLHRKGLLPRKQYRDDADMILREICEFDGMSEEEAGFWFRGVRWFAGGAAISSVHSDEQDKTITLEYKEYGQKAGS